MIAAAAHTMNMFNTDYIEPTIEWSKKNKMTITALGISILLGVMCYNSPQICNIMKKSIKSLTVVFPLVYSLSLPMIICRKITGEGFYTNEMIEVHYQEVGKVWQAWFAFVSA